jgi:folylpolyglutamate synthase/dihydropteroate synthase
MSLKKDGDRVFIAGSLYLVGEIKRIAGTPEEG